MGCFKVVSTEKSGKAELMVTSKMYANSVELNPSEKSLNEQDQAVSISIRWKE